MSKEKVLWIDGLKFIACLCVFWSHIFGTLEFTQLPVLPVPVLSTIFKYLSILLMGNFWVFIFCFISGYFAGNKKINTFKELISAIINRYIRFVLPFAFSSLIIIALYYTVGFRAEELGSIYGNEWIAPFYAQPLTPLKILKYIFLMDDEINPFIWTIRQIYIGNILTYVMNFLTNRFDSKKRTIIYFAVFLVLTSYSVLSNGSLIYSFACFFGALLPVVFPLLKKINQSVSTICFLTTVVLLQSHNYIVGKIFEFVQLPGNPDYYMINIYWNFLYAVIFLVFLSNTDFLKKGLSNKFLNKISSMSLAVYFNHCSLLYSVCLAIFSVLIKNNVSNFDGLLFFIVSNIIVIVFSIIYEKTLGKISNNIFFKFKTFFDKKLKSI